MNTTQIKGGQYVVFSIHDQLCALAIEEVVEIIRTQPITAVPGTDSFIEGMINLRGTIIPVVNVRTRYQIQPIPADKKTRIVIVRYDGEEIGLIVDEIRMITNIADRDVEPPLDTFNLLEKDNFLAFAKVDDKLVGILNIEKVLVPQH